MLGNRNYLTFHVPGTLTANLSIKWKVPKPCSIKHISAVASNDSDATLAVGGGSDGSTVIMAAATIGDSGTPNEKTRSNWATTNPTGQLAEGDILALTIDYDGAAGTAADDLTLVLTLLDGG